MKELLRLVIGRPVQVSCNINSTKLIEHFKLSLISLITFYHLIYGYQEKFVLNTLILILPSCKTYVLLKDTNVENFLKCFNFKKLTKHFKIIF